MRRLSDNAFRRIAHRLEGQVERFIPDLDWEDNPHAEGSPQRLASEVYEKMLKAIGDVEVEHSSTEESRKLWEDAMNVLLNEYIDGGLLRSDLEYHIW